MISMHFQNIDGDMLPEIGYHINKRYWRQGFAKEAAIAVRNWVFRNKSPMHTLLQEKDGVKLYVSECDEIPGEIIYEDAFQIAVKNQPEDAVIITKEI